MTTDQAIAQAFLRVVARIRELEQANLPCENDVLAQWRAGRRSAAREIAAWMEHVAREYEQQGETR